MDATKVLVVANAPGILQRVEDTLSGLEVRVAIRLRDVAATARRDGCDVVILYLGFEPQSTVALIASLVDEPDAHPPAIVCLAPLERPGAMSELEAQVRSAGADEFINLAEYPNTRGGNEVLRKRILTAARAQRGSPATRVLRRALRLAGGTGRLARHLDVPEADLARWMRGEEEPPDRVFLAAFDLVLTELERGLRKPS